MPVTYDLTVGVVGAPKRDSRFLCHQRLWVAAAACVAVLVFAATAAAVSPGDFDQTFGSGGVIADQFGSGANAQTDAGAVAVQPDGKVLVGGDVWLSGEERLLVMRLNPDGTLDSSFANGGKLIVQLGQGSSPQSAVNGLAVQGDGRIVITGHVSDSSGNDELLVARLNPDGSFDSSFGSGGKVITQLGQGGAGAGSYGRAAAIDSTGRVVLDGSATDSSLASKVFVARFNSDGSPDSSFGSGGAVIVNSPIEFARGLAVQADGKVLVSGYDPASSDTFAVLRLTSSGVLDGSFGSGGEVIQQLGQTCMTCAAPISEADALTVQPDGRVVVVGEASDSSGHDDSLIVRLHPDGSFDSSFGAGGVVRDDMGLPNAGGPYSSLAAVIVMPNGKLLVGGRASDANRYGAFLIARLKGDGTLDSSFGSGGEVVSQFGLTPTSGSPDSAVNALALDESHGKLVAASGATDTNGYPKLLVARLIADLSPTASLAITPNPVQAGNPVTFAGAASDPDGTIAGYAWNYGDGTTGTGATATHTYATAGTYTVTLTVTDDAGATAGATGTETVTAPPAPRFSHVFQTHHRWREGNALVQIARKRRPPVGTTFGFTLSEPARVTLSFIQKHSGRRVGHRCTVPTKHNKHRPRCSRTTVAGTLSLTAQAGANTVRFAGRLSRTRRLKPGAYTLIITATNSYGETATATLRFLIVTR